MDKNTIYGLILMALIFLGFMWLGPKHDKTMESESAATEQTLADSPSETAPDALSANEMEWLKRNVASNGDLKVLEDGTRVYTHKDGALDVTLRGDSIYG
ncbi:MAG: hypothetical protein K2F87_03095, partial [Muribaculaceae bacterium]|nr:hypothetical protein [Muribaculaceae bacterium]